MKSAPTFKFIFSVSILAFGVVGSADSETKVTLQGQNSSIEVLEKRTGKLVDRRILAVERSHPLSWGLGETVFLYTSAKPDYSGGKTDSSIRSLRFDSKEDADLLYKIVSEQKIPFRLEYGKAQHASSSYTGPHPWGPDVNATFEIKGRKVHLPLPEALKMIRDNELASEKYDAASVKSALETALIHHFAAPSAPTGAKTNGKLDGKSDVSPPTGRTPYNNEGSATGGAAESLGFGGGKLRYADPIRDL